MAKLTRIFQNLFGRDGDQAHFGEFGSRSAGSPFNTKDPAVIQALAAFVTNGWKDAINGSNKAPFLEDMNGLFLLIFRQIAYLLQEGNAEWDGSTTYYIGSIVKKTGTFELYGSLTDNNTGNALPSQTNNANWQYLNTSTNWTGYTPSTTGMGTGSSEAFYKRIGDTLFLNGRINAGTCTADPVSITLPAGYTIDSTKLPTAQTAFLGSWVNLITNASPDTIYSSNWGGAAFFDGSDTGKIFFTAKVGSVVFNKQNGNAMLISGSPFTFNLQVPVL